MAIVQWDPFGDISTLRQQMDRLLNRRDDDQTFVPPIDVFEDRGQLVIKAEIPGIDPKDLEVSIDENTLCIRGERRFEEQTEEEGFYRIERKYGRFERYLPLPQGVDAELIEASYDNGVLEVRVPKPEQAQPRRLDIQCKGGQQQVEAQGQTQGETQEQTQGNLPMRQGVDMDKVSRSEMPYVTEREVEQGIEPPSGETKAA